MPIVPNHGAIGVVPGSASAEKQTQQKHPQPQRYVPSEIPPPRKSAIGGSTLSPEKQKPTFPQPPAKVEPAPPIEEDLLIASGYDSPNENGGASEGFYSKLQHQQEDAFKKIGKIVEAALLHQEKRLEKLLKVYLRKTDIKDTHNALADCNKLATASQLKPHASGQHLGSSNALGQSERDTAHEEPNRQIPLPGQQNRRISHQPDPTPSSLPQFIPMTPRVRRQSVMAQVVQRAPPAVVVHSDADGGKRKVSTGGVLHDAKRSSVLHDAQAPPRPAPLLGSSPRPGPVEEEPPKPSASKSSHDAPSNRRSKQSTRSSADRKSDRTDPRKSDRTDPKTHPTSGNSGLVAPPLSAGHDRSSTQVLSCSGSELTTVTTVMPFHAAETEVKSERSGQSDAEDSPDEFNKAKTEDSQPELRPEIAEKLQARASTRGTQQAMRKSQSAGYLGMGKSQSDVKKESAPIIRKSQSAVNFACADSHKSHPDDKDKDSDIDEDSDEDEDFEEENADFEEHKRRHGSRRFSEWETAQRDEMLTMHRDSELDDMHTNTHKETWWVKAVNGQDFARLSAFLLVANVTVMGFEVEQAVADDVYSQAFLMCNIFFCCLFSIELALRIAAARIRTFYLGAGWEWAWFDSAVIFMQIVEVILTFVYMESDSFWFLTRLMQFARLVRVLRIVRVMRFFRSFRVLLIMILGTMRNGMWAGLLLMLIMYVFAIVFRQAVVDHMSALKPDDETHPLLDDFYGTLPRVVFTLFMSIIGGINWHEAILPLSDCGWVNVFFFLVYILFVQLVVMNVVTGLFLQSAIEQASQDQEHGIQLRLQERQTFVQRLETLFKELDSTENGKLSLQEFETHLQSSHMQALLHTFEIENADAWTFFKLLDADGGGSVDIEEFVAGCIRLKGSARSIQAAQLMYHDKWIMNELVELDDAVEQYIKPLYGYLRLILMQLEDLTLAAEVAAEERDGGGGGGAAPRLSIKSRRSRVSVTATSRKSRTSVAAVAAQNRQSLKGRRSLRASTMPNLGDNDLDEAEDDSDKSDE